MTNAPDKPLPAYFIGDQNDQTGRHGSIAVWCPFCETVHYHGAAGGGADPRTEHRVSHCSSGPSKGRSYSLDIVGTVGNGEELAPRPYLATRGDPLQSRLKFQHVLNTGAMARALIRTLFGNRPASGFDAKLAGGACHVVRDGGTWWITDAKGRTVAAGHGLGLMIAGLFKTSLGVVALRLIESILGFDMPDDHRLAIVSIIDRAGAGRPVPVLADLEDRQ